MNNSRTIVAYRTLRGETPGDVTGEVTRHLEQNWQPYGSMLWANARDGYIQVVVQYEKPPVKKLLSIEELEELSGNTYINSAEYI